METVALHIGWKWLPTEGNQGVFESIGDPAKTASPIFITATGLQSGAVYEVLGYFRADGFAGAEMNARKLLPSLFAWRSNCMALAEDLRVGRDDR